MRIRILLVCTLTALTTHITSNTDHRKIEQGLQQTVYQTIKPIAELQPIQPIKPVPTCESEIYNYDWDHSVAYKVMIAESGGREWIVNNDPNTEDYSVGCFQINLYGDNALYRPSESELKKPEINVAFAYSIYVNNGHSFLGQWGVCRNKVACY